MYVTLSAKRLHNSLGYLVHNSLVVTWFERARAIERAFVVDDWVGIDKLKLVLSTNSSVLCRVFLSQFQQQAQRESGVQLTHNFALANRRSGKRLRQGGRVYCHHIVSRHHFAGLAYEFHRGLAFCFLIVSGKRPRLPT